MASLRRVRKIACDGKVRHETKGAAYVAAHRTGNGREVKPYKCQFCGCWHVGHQPTGPKRRRQWKTV